MEQKEQVLSEIRALLKSQKLCVLATHNKVCAFANLIAYSYKDDFSEFYFITPEKTRKYGLLLQQNKVSLLMDNRSQISRLEEGRAVTFTGEAAEISKNAEIKDFYLARNSEFREFFNSDLQKLFKVKVDEIFYARSFEQIIKLEPGFFK